MSPNADPLGELADALVNNEPIPLRLAVLTKDLQVLWDSCENPRAMLSLVVRVDKRSATRAACEIAKTCLPVVTAHDRRVRTALKNATLWADHRLPIKALEQSVLEIETSGRTYHRVAFDCIRRACSIPYSKTSEQDASMVPLLATVSVDTQRPWNPKPSELRESYYRRIDDRQRPFAKTVRNLIPIAPDLREVIIDHLSKHRAME